MEKKTIGEQLDALNETLREAERQFGVFEVSASVSLDENHALEWCKQGTKWGLYVEHTPQALAVLAGAQFELVPLLSANMKLRVLAAAKLRELYAACVATEKRIAGEIAAAHKTTKDFVTELTVYEDEAQGSYER